MSKRRPAGLNYSSLRCSYEEEKEANQKKWDALLNRLRPAQCADCGRNHHPENKCELDFVPPHNPNRKPGDPDVRQEAIQAVWEQTQEKLEEDKYVVSRPRTS